MPSDTFFKLLTGLLLTNRHTKAILDPWSIWPVISVPSFVALVQISMTFSPPPPPPHPACHCLLDSDHLDPLTFPLSFFKESKALLASTFYFLFKLVKWRLSFLILTVTVTDWIGTRIHFTFLQGLHYFRWSYLPLVPDKTPYLTFWEWWEPGVR